MLSRCLPPLFRSVGLRQAIVYRNGSPLQSLRLGWTGAHTRLKLSPWTLPQFSTYRALRMEDGPQYSPKQDPKSKLSIRENIYTLPNFLTVSRILACPILGWSVLNNDFYLATGLLAYAGASDLIDGYLARRFNMQSVLGTILDPAADKILMTTLVVTLTMKGLLPLPLGAVILGRDVLLSLSAFYIRYTSLPVPKTFTRYWDFSIPSAEVRPTQISKINTALQLALMAQTTITPILPAVFVPPLEPLQLMVAITTIWSGVSYVFSKDAVRIISERRKPKPPSP